MTEGAARSARADDTDRVAIQREPRVRASYDALLARGKHKMQANVAVMRKLLHTIYGMTKHGERFDPEKLYRMAA